MSKLNARLLVLVALVVGAGAVQAMPIVTVNGRDWLQPADFLFDYATINQTCNAVSGECSGKLGETDITGYTWAAIDDVNALFNWLGGLELGPGPDKEYWFYIWERPETSFAYQNFFNAGFDKSFSFADSTYVYEGLEAYTRDIGTVGAVTFNATVDRYGFGIWTNQVLFETTVKDKQYNPTGGWFFKDILPPGVVPIPSTMALFGLGLAALGYSRRKGSDNLTFSIQLNPVGETHATALLHSANAPTLRSR